jgi:hypothetical protein
MSFPHAVDEFLLGAILVCCVGGRGSGEALGNAHVSSLQTFSGACDPKVVS